MTRASTTPCWPEFRGRVAEAGLEQVVLDALLARLAAEGLVKAGGKQRTDSTHVVAAVAALNRLELAGESVRAALEALAAAHPDWVEQRICVSDFARRYGTPMTSWRPPAVPGRGGMSWRSPTPGTGTRCWRRSTTAPRRPGCASCPRSDVLRRVLLQNYTRTITGDGREVIRRREKEPEGDGLPPGHARIASPYDTDARWGVKREEFWLGYKLHVTETCDDRPAVHLPPGRRGGGRGRRGREHDQGCAHLVFPNLITHVATTDATVTDNQMTGAIHDDAGGKEPGPGTALPRFRLPQRRPGGLGAGQARHRADRAAAGRHLRAGPRRRRLRPRRLHRRLRHQDRHLPARQDLRVLDAVHPARQGRDRGHLLRQRLRPLPGPPPVHHQQQETTAAHRACPATWPKPRPPPAPRKRRSRSRPTTPAAPASKAPCTRPPATAPAAPATAACPKPASTTSTWPARSTCSACRPTGPAPR